MAFESGQALSTCPRDLHPRGRRMPTLPQDARCCPVEHDSGKVRDGSKTREFLSPKTACSHSRRKLNSKSAHRDGIHSWLQVQPAPWEA